MTLRPAEPGEYNDVLAALSDPTRQRILERLSSDGPMNASQMATTLPISRQAIVKHLRILESGGLVSARAHGRSVEFSVRPERTTQAAQWLAQTAAAWEQRLAALAALAYDRSERGVRSPMPEPAPTATPTSKTATATPAPKPTFTSRTPRTVRP